jgi:drug/metabolite transporter (DMT)-like permease
LLRYLVASLTLAVYAMVTRMPLPERRDIPRFALLGFLGFTAYNVAINAGEVGISAGVASFIVAGAPIMMALGGILFFGERLKRLGWVGIGICLLGVAIITLTSEDGLSLQPAALLVLLAAICQAAYSVGQKPMLKKYGALRFVTYAVWAGAAFLLVFVPGLLRDLPTAAPEATFAVVYMGIFPGALGYLTWSLVLSRVPAAIAGTFLYGVPVCAVIIAWLWLGEVPGVLALLGGALVIAGVVVVNTRGR